MSATGHMKCKVAHITTVSQSLRYLLLNQLAAIRDEGYEVVAISSPGPDVAAVQAAGLRHQSVPMTRSFTPLGDVVSLWRLFRLMRRERFAIVHTHNPKPGLLGQIAARAAGVPIVVNTLHGFYFHSHMPPLRRRFYIIVERVAARFSDVILSQNSEDLPTAIAQRICPPEKIMHLGNGIDLRRFDLTRLDPNAVAETRIRLGIATDTAVVGFVGRLVAEKGVLDLLAAARRLADLVAPVRFLLVGPTDVGKADAIAPSIAEDFGVADLCVFTGVREDMPELYALMDVFVLPSYREGFPRSPMEASAIGVPCVVTDIRGCREAVVHGRNGLVVPLGDVPALAAAIAELLNDRDKAARLGQTGRQMALERFDERRVFERVKSTYAGLLREKGLPVPTPHSCGTRLIT